MITAAAIRRADTQTPTRPRFRLILRYCLVLRELLATCRLPPARHGDSCHESGQGSLHRLDLL